MSVRCTFRLSVQVSDDELPCITGSVASLGQWRPEHVVKMQRSDEHFVCQINLDANVDVVNFRYVVCTFVHRRDEQRERVVVRRWETELLPRSIRVAEVSEEPAVHSFGYVGKEYNVQLGWLHTETLVEFKLFEDAVDIWPRGKLRSLEDISVKVAVVDNDTTSSLCWDEDSNDTGLFSHSSQHADRAKWPIVCVADLNDEDSRLRVQGNYGLQFKRDSSFITFQAQVFDLQSITFRVDIYGRKSREGEKMHVGSCYVHPSQFTSTEGRVKTTIVSKGFRPIGQFSAVFLVVHALNFDDLKNLDKDTERSERRQFSGCDLSVSYARHWKPHWKGLDVGHRGLGNSYSSGKDCSHIRENSIASLKEAAAHGADMVEFDVQISKDGIPVIYHDFELCTASRIRGEEKVKLERELSADHLVQMPLKSLTLKQLQRLRIHHVQERASGVLRFFADDCGVSSVADSDHAPFPTLESALKSIDEHVGFNIEIKWDMELRDGSREAHNPFEMNLFTDTVIKAVFKHAEERKIFFSSFNPDICMVLRCKQNRYPVLFLTQGINSKYEMYRDPRTWNIANGSAFVNMAELLGLNVMAEDLLRDPKQIEVLRQRHQVVFSWTDDRSDKDTIAYLKALGVDGVIYDRMDQNNSKVNKESVFRSEKRMTREKNHEDNSSSGVSSGDSTCSSIGSPTHALF